MPRRRKAVLAILVALYATPVLAGDLVGNVAALAPETKSFLVRALIDEHVLAAEVNANDNEQIATAVADYYLKHKDEFRRDGDETTTVDMVICLLAERGHAVGQLMNGSLRGFCQDNLKSALR
ncbi:MAG TPA: hypothetical protein VGO04_25465 [Ensifer sp.]|jgi:hypothetical protein|uniref:hypothetical protein n=1 Tax=Ensifer sp. TaxID=1872086 RepID=UPI002E0F5FF2|nr:hypothetical protein [Ensifer sp.]